MSKVVIFKENNYYSSSLKGKIEKILTEEFNIWGKLSPQDKVLLKPNLLSAVSPYKAVTTHPQFVRIVGEIFKEKGFEVFIADNPMANLKKEEIEEVYEICGIKDISQECGFKLLYPEKVKIKDNIPFSWWIDNFKIVNLPKLKTHQLTRLTLATKNLYGCISGYYKSYLHRLYPKSEEFTFVLLKIYHLIKPLVNILDGIWALEGEGPSSEGKRKDCFLVAIGEDPLYLDYAISEILPISSASIPLIRKAKELGLLEEEKLELKIFPSDFQIKNFKMPLTPFWEKFPNFFINFLKIFLNLKIKIDKNKCQGCRKCFEVCPQKAIIMEGNKAKIIGEKCILCFCCYEVCRFMAVKVEKHWLLNLYNKLYNKLQ